VYPKVVIIAAGVYADVIADMAGDQFYSIHPRKGTNSILDKKATGKTAQTIVRRMGGDGNDRGADAAAHTKGGGIVLTAHRNILVGPDAAEIPEREDFSTTPESIRGSFAKHRATAPALSQNQIITYFSGVRAATYEEDFVVCKGRRTGYLVHAAGIQSPGLTAAPAIAVDVARYACQELEAQGVAVAPNAGFNGRRNPIPHMAAMSDVERAALIRERPDYGAIVCRCEEVSRGEVLDSLRRPVPCDTVDGVKRRVRPGMGRCQGGFCGPLVLQIIAEEKGIPPEKVLKNGLGSEVLCGKTK
jgi:glycerol-3-phosphate dehydrogenase